MRNTLRALTAVCAVLMSSCQALSGLDQLTTSDDAGRTDEDYVETRTTSGWLDPSLWPDPDDTAQDLDAGEDAL